MTGNDLNIDRFAMASALVERAQSHKEWIGDDHGDRYEEALVSGAIPEEMQIVIKEIFDHLRAALDYCAQEVWRHFSGNPQGAKVYFPIAKKGTRENEFLSIMNRLMPGVARASSPAYEAFKSFQAFADQDNSWLPELATVVNQTKHFHLQVASIPQRSIVFAHNGNGVSLMSFAEGHAPSRGTAPWMMIKATQSEIERGGTFDVAFLQLTDIQMELRLFLHEAISGVSRVIEECRKLVT
ncbi:hypothetical protein [Rhodomicrobium lacus]|uniref:hypothetical protein n=1 Tax=Rhodomicrobium lacus TaxID=2498452 RepID=UPI0013E03566|nr:hypothetical protein [Rhodomicrobium lacus]